MCLSLRSQRAQWVMRNSQTAKQQTDLIKLAVQLFIFPLLPLLHSEIVPSFNTEPYPFVPLLFCLLCDLNKLGIKWGGRRDLGDEACQNVNRWQGVLMRRVMERKGAIMWWKERSIPWKPGHEKKWLMRPDVKLMLHRVLSQTERSTIWFCFWIEKPLP